MRIKRMVSRTSVALAMTGAAFCLPAAPADAAVFNVGISVGSDGASTAYVSGLNGNYTVVLTASGGGTCALANAPVVIGGANFGNGSASVGGAPCTIYDGQATYEMVYYSTNSLLPVGGFYRECTWALGSMVCSPEGVTL